MHCQCHTVCLHGPLGIHNNKIIDSEMFQLIETKTTIQMEIYSSVTLTVEAHNTLAGLSQINMQKMIVRFYTCGVHAAHMLLLLKKKRDKPNTETFSNSCSGFLFFFILMNPFEHSEAIMQLHVYFSCLLLMCTSYSRVFVDCLHNIC